MSGSLIFSSCLRLDLVAQCKTWVMCDVCVPGDAPTPILLTAAVDKSADLHDLVAYLLGEQPRCGESGTAQGHVV